MKKLLVIALFAIALLGCAHKKAPRNESAKIGENQRAELTRVLRVGREIFRKDQLASTGTDVLFERVDPTRYPDMIGWVVHDVEDAQYVTFYSGSLEAPDVIADIIFDGSARPTILTEPQRSASEVERSMLRARTIGLENGWNSCSERFNTVVLQSPREDAWDVYVLAATMDPNLVQVGGHSRITVAKADGRVLDTFSFSASCLTMDKSPENIPAGARLSSVIVSHVVSDLPSETHVFLSYLHDMEIVVTTDFATLGTKDGKIIVYQVKAPAAGTP